MLSFITDRRSIGKPTSPLTSFTTLTGLASSSPFELSAVQAPSTRIQTSAISDQYTKSRTGLPTSTERTSGGSQDDSECDREGKLQ